MITFDQALTIFQTFLITEKRAPTNTVRAYSNDIEQLGKFFQEHDVTLHSYTKKDLMAFLQKMLEDNISASSRARKLAAMRLFFNLMVERCQIANHIISIKAPKVEQRLPSYLSESEITQLLDTAQKDQTDRGIRNCLMIYLLYSAGLRVSELLDLMPSSVRLDTGFLVVIGKRSKERFVPLPTQVLSLLNVYITTHRPKLFPKSCDDSNTPLFFTVRRGAVCSISRQGCWLIVKALLRASGIIRRVYPHSLRHSLATHLLKNGANLRSLQLLMGHESIATIQVYTHLERDGLREIYDKAHSRS